MLNRKIEKDIIRWIENGKNALLISGARQTGKTFIIKEILRRTGCDFVCFNLIDQPEVVQALEAVSGRDASAFIERLSVMTSHNLIKGKTVIFFDEVQEYRDLVTKIKFMVEEGSFRYVLSGSLLGVELAGIKSAPVGYLTSLDMFPLDFEEFLWALGLRKETFESLRDCFDSRRPVDEVVHARILEAFRTYLVVGGMPQAVASYVKHNDFQKVDRIQKDIIRLYKLDFTKYERASRLKLARTYDLIPSELASRNKRYIFTDLDPNLRFDRYENSFNWLIDAGVAIPVFNVTEPHLPLETNRKSNLFKLFQSDVGLLTCLYGKATKIAILDGSDSLKCGAIYENVVAQELNAHGFRCCYFNSKKHGELDFVTEYNGAVLPLEIKSGKDYTTHSALDNVLKTGSYRIGEAFVFSNANVSVDGNVVYYPIYMVSMLDGNPEIGNRPRPDLSGL